jgi:hypothetical protein
MTRRVAGVVFLVALLPAGCGGGGLDWKEVTSTDGRFKVLMPAEPVQQTVKEEPPVGPITVYFSTVKYKSDGFFAGWADLPPKPPFATEDLLQGVAKRYDHATVKSSKEVTFQDNPGREFELESAGARKIVGRLYVVKDRLYELLVIGDGPRPPAEAEVKRFFDSFQLLDPLMK